MDNHYKNASDRMTEDNTNKMDISNKITEANTMMETDATILTNDVADIRKAKIEALKQKCENKKAASSIMITVESKANRVKTFVENFSSNNEMKNQKSEALKQKCENKKTASTIIPVVESKANCVKSPVEIFSSNEDLENQEIETINQEYETKKASTKFTVESKTNRVKTSVENLKNQKIEALKQKRENQNPNETITVELKAKRCNTPVENLDNHITEAVMQKYENPKPKRKTSSAESKANRSNTPMGELGPKKHLKNQKIEALKQKRENQKPNETITVELKAKCCNTLVENLDNHITEAVMQKYENQKTRKTLSAESKANGNKGSGENLNRIKCLQLVKRIPNVEDNKDEENVIYSTARKIIDLKQSMTTDDHRKTENPTEKLKSQIDLSKLNLLLSSDNAKKNNFIEETPHEFKKLLELSKDDPTESKEFLQDLLKRSSEALKYLHTEYTNLKQKYDLLKLNEVTNNANTNENIILKVENEKLNSKVMELESKIKSYEKEFLKKNTKEAFSQIMPHQLLISKLNRLEEVSVNKAKDKKHTQQLPVSKKTKAKNEIEDVQGQKKTNNSNKTRIHVMARFKATSNVFKHQDKKSEKMGYSLTSSQKIFYSNSKQEDIFEAIKPHIKSAMNGSKICLSTYGPVNSGKTYTMMGTKNDPGISYRLIAEIFEFMKEQKDSNYSLRMSVLQVYNEIVIDLLSDKIKFLSLTEESHTYSDHIKGLIEKQIAYIEDWFEYIDISLRRKINNKSWFMSNSYQSHYIIFLHIDGRSLRDNTTTNGLITLCDLAGFDDEKLITNQSKYIDKSLTSFINVLKSIHQNKKMITFRDCKLTSLLKYSLLEASDCIIILSLSTLEETFSKSIRSLETFRDILSNKEDDSPDCSCKTSSSLSKNKEKTALDFHRRKTHSLTKLPVRISPKSPEINNS